VPRGIDADGDVHRTDGVPEGARVRRFDELADPAQQYPVRAAEGVSPRDPRNVPGLNEGDVVVFTDYYRIG